MTVLRSAVDDEEHVRGPATAPYTLVEYGDFQCPYCGEAFWELRRLVEAAAPELRFVFRHFPMSQVHPHAMIAAEAAEAAGAQGQFWEMHDLLFRNQHRLEPSALLQYASALDLDLQRFASDLQQHRWQSKVRRHFVDGVRSGVNRTPTLFINGHRYNGPVTVGVLYRMIAADEGISLG
ncbi:MAG: DsbA family protein [Deltaproteobacteria bacterium]|nr:DsbA family protein [Deltaproteobacteria bacterium]